MTSGTQLVHAMDPTSRERLQEIALFIVVYVPGYGCHLHAGAATCPSLWKKYHAAQRRANTLLAGSQVLGQGGDVGINIAHGFWQALFVDNLGVLPTQ